MPDRPPTARKKARLAHVRGATRLAVEAAAGVVDAVEAMHLAIGEGPAVLGRPLAAPVRWLTGPIYRAIRALTRGVGAAVDLGLAGTAEALAPLGGGPPPAAQDPVALAALVAALNGVVGDHLAESANPLATEPCLVHGGRVLELSADAPPPLPGAAGTLLVLVHGSCLNDRWLRRGHDHGAALAADLGVTPVYARYNSGRHVSQNGRILAELLERLVVAQPGFDRVILLGHSMGGLVSRSACHEGEVLGHAWRRKLRKLVCLGTPHHGSHLERGGHWIQVLLGVSRYSAPLGVLARLRSAGVTDLRHGNVLEEHWAGRDRFAHGPDARSPLPLPEDVDCYAMAGVQARAGARGSAGDGLVPVESALGRHRDPARDLAFPEAHRWVAPGTGHLDLLGRAGVYEVLRIWLAEVTPPEVSAPCR